MPAEKISHNNVNEISLVSRVSSSGRDEQVAPDSHTATVSNGVKIAAWNVRTLYHPGKLEKR